MPAQARSMRAAAAAKYLPHQVQTLLIAEAPPQASDRYFYFESVTKHDSLFRHVAAGILGTPIDRGNKREALQQIMLKGFFLIDLSADPIVAGSNLASLVPALVPRAKALSPLRIILIKANVFDLLYNPLTEAGLPVVNRRIPFPGSGQQKRFNESFTAALR